MLQGLSALARGVWQSLVLWGSRMVGTVVETCTPRPQCCGMGGQRQVGGSPEPHLGGHTSRLC